MDWLNEGGRPWVCTQAPSPSSYLLMIQIQKEYDTAGVKPQESNDRLSKVGLSALGALALIA